jgi:hypothetical protein
VAAIRTAHRAAHAESALREIQSVAHRPADAVVIHPANEFLIDAALVDQVLQQPADGALSANAVTTAVSRPKQRFSPRATLYSPPPS